MDNENMNPTNNQSDSYNTNNTNSNNDTIYNVSFCNSENNNSNNNTYQETSYVDFQNNTVDNTNYSDNYNSSNTDLPYRKTKKRKALFWSIMPTTVVLLGLCVGYSTYYWSTLSDLNIDSSLDINKGTSQDNAEQYANPNGPQISSQDTPIGSSSENNAETAYEVIQKSVVSIKAYTSNSSGHQGSGVIIDKSGYIVTNSHVIGDTRDIRVSVILNNDKVYSADVIGFDADIDIAVLKIDAENLLPATFANSDNIKIGQTALAIGSPYGSGFSNSLTQGIVSALDRKLTLSTTVKYIQTDAAINPGNSGGPLINIYGQVMGINTAKISATGYEGMGFAIPSNTVIDVANQIIKNGYVVGRARIGAIIGLLSENNEYGLEYGAEIVEFSETNAFSGTNINEGDIILEMDGIKLYSLVDIDNVLNKHSPGDEVEVIIYKPNTKETITTKIKFISSSSL